MRLVQEDRSLNFGAVLPSSYNIRELASSDYHLAQFRLMFPNLPAFTLESPKKPIKTPAQEMQRYWFVYSVSSINMSFTVLWIFRCATC